MKTDKIRPSLIGVTTGLFLLLMSMASPLFAQTEWNVGISGGSGGIDGFTFSMGQYYGVPERDIVVIRERGIYEEELPVVFFIARMAGVHPGLVADLRMRGMSWMDITYYFGLRPDVYYVPVVVHRYVPAYGYYHSHPRGTWKRGDLRDRDIVNQVNLKFMSEHHRYAPEKIMRYRNEGRSFRVIDRDISHERTVKDRDRISRYGNDMKVDQNRQKAFRPVQGVQKPARPHDNKLKQGNGKANARQAYVHNDKGNGTRWRGN